jgi:hypothetical protein
LREKHLFKHETLVWLNGQIAEWKQVSAEVNQAAFRSANHEMPVGVSFYPLQHIDIVVLAITEQNDLRFCRQQGLNLFQDLDVLICCRMTFLASIHDPGQRQSSLLIDDAYHQRHAASTHLTTIHRQNQWFTAQGGSQCLSKGHVIHT